MSATAQQQAQLWIVATPIGNLADFSPRAQQVLQDVDVIASEDTRHSQVLLTQMGINTPMISYHEHNEAPRAKQLLSYLEKGQSVAVISDAGTPLISDPGYSVVHLARQKGYCVKAVPGACAAITALSIAGLPTDQFLFVGFLPAKQGSRRNRLQALSMQTATLVLYESRHRISQTAQDLNACLGGTRQVLVARELTKRFEQSQSMALKELPVWLEQQNHQRGEFVLVIEGAKQQANEQLDIDALLQELVAVTSTKDAAKIASRLTRQPKNELYQRALVLKQGNK